MHLIPSTESNSDKQADVNLISTTVYGSRLAGVAIPRFELSEEEMPARSAAKFVEDELLMDGRPALNLASFVTTYMEPECEQLMLNVMSKNAIDVEEYPSIQEIESRCVNIIARLFNVPLDAESNAMGVSTVGSSEAIILAVLAAKRRWANARRAAGKSTTNPNIVMSSLVQVCWEKAARYLEVEERYWNCREGVYLADPKELIDLVDENTILVCAILGTTYTGGYEDVAAMNDLLIKKNEQLGTDVHIHVDGASGGFVVPFTKPDLLWDFRLPLVCSINASGHKYGGVYAGVGWAIWRSKEFVPEDILFTVNYLGSPQVSFTLNFSKSAVQVIGQYYMFLRLGKNGYKAVLNNLMSTADYLAQSISEIDGGERFELMTVMNGDALPLVAWRLKKGYAYDEFAIAKELRMRGWIVPAYNLAKNAEGIKLLRVVCRNDFSRSRCETFVKDLKHALSELDRQPESMIRHNAKHSGASTVPATPITPVAGQGQTKFVMNEKHSLRNHGKGKTHAIC